MSQAKFATYPFKYAPQSIDEMLVDDWTKAKLKDVVEKVPNIIIHGPPGVGKSCFVDLFLKLTGFDFLKINASDERGIGTIRERVSTFARAASLSQFKIIWLNEGDALTEEAQDNLRQLIEDVEAHTRFIITCNYVNKLSAPMQSRFQDLELASPPATEIFERCMYILKQENVEIENLKSFKKDLVELIKKCYPDIRKIFNRLETSVVDGKISKVLLNVDQVYEQILNFLLVKELGEIRSLLKSHSIYYPALYQYLFDNIDKFELTGEAILAIGEALRWDNTVAIKEINFITMCAKMLKEGVV